MIYLSDFVSPKEESNLLEFIDHGTWNTELKRRTQHYGYKYSYRSRIISMEEPLPIVFNAICDRLVANGLFSKRPEQVIVNEYLPGQGIASHTDSNIFGPVVASLSLGSGIEMNIGPELIYLEPRSLLVMSGESRTRWKHGIPARKSDIVNGRKVPRQRRVSVTFRTLA